MKDLRVFYNISVNYWAEISSSNPDEYIRLLNIDSLKEKDLFNEGIKKGNFMNSLSDFNCDTEEEYHVATVLLEDERKAFCFEKKSGEFDIEKNKERARQIKSICTSFRFKHKNNLQNNVLTDNCDMDIALQEISKYIFCDYYSLWLYNDITKYYTLVSSSFPIEHDFKKSEYEFSDEQIGKGELEKMELHSRIEINLESQNKEKDSRSYLIAKFYSKYNDYPLKEETEALIKEIVTLKYTKTSFPKIIASNKVMAVLNKEFSLGKFDDYLNDCVSVITEKLGWEASSIFIKDNNENLKLKALKHSGKSDRVGEVIYKKDEDSITYGIFKNKDPQYFYDIDKQPENSHKFDEETENKSQNWIGMPIFASGIKPIGVLRVKNKLNKSGSLVNFDNLDIIILKNLAENTAYQFNIEQKLIEYDRFIKASRHEIKTPLSLITTVSSRLRNKVCDEYNIDKENVPKKINEVLVDLEAVTSRLIFIVNSLSFKAKDLVHDIGRNYLFYGIVVPIASFSKVHAEKNKKFLDIDKDSIWKLPAVNCGINSSQMVFHIVVDNAIKYSRRNSIIKVFGEQDRGYCRIIVESDSIVTIKPDEKTRIFEEYYRTKEVEKKRFEGSGIGLYLASEIMKLNDGKIILSNLNNPTRFELVFRKYDF